MKKNKKYLKIIITLIILIIITSLFLIKKNKPKNTQNNNTELSFQEINDKIIRQETENRNKPVYNHIINGAWDKIEEELNTAKDSKTIQWIINQTTNEIINNGKILNSINSKDYFKYLLDKTDSKYSNIYYLNLIKLVKFTPNNFIEFQDQLINKYNILKSEDNIKLILLELILSFNNEKIIPIFKEAITSKHQTFIISALRSVKNFKHKSISQELIKLSKHENHSIKASSFKVLAIQKNPYVKEHITSLIESKNPYLVEAGLFIIDELNLANSYKDILINNLNNMEHFNKTKAQRLLDNF